MTFDSKDTLPTRGTVDETGQPATLQTAADLRATTGLFGAGYLEMLARQITEELQRIRNTIKLDESKELVAKGIHFGKLTLTKEGLWDASKVEGLVRLSVLPGVSINPPSLVIRPWHQAGNVVSPNRLAANDGDGDGSVSRGNELFVRAVVLIDVPHGERHAGT